MCGIAGFYSQTEQFSENELRNITEKLAHRGPDAEGYFYNSKVGLGHKRLSIIDLSQEANQPMYSHSGQYIIVFNGEIYNFKEIAQELQLKQKTSSDTEILVEAFAKWGPDFVNKVNGMFSIAIYCNLKNELFLFRDRLGIKPLFYYLHNNELVFASELKSILALEKINSSKEINQEAVQEFLQLGYVPAPHTIYKNIYKFPKGSYGVFDGQELVVSQYWSVEDQVHSNMHSSTDSAKEELNSLISSSVKYRLIADVPYGTFLSGGVDSSLVSAVAQKVSNHQLKTFSIGFDDPKFNETRFARQVAKHIESDHHELILTEKDALNLVPDLFAYYDEPYADASALPTMLVSKMAREKVTMTLSGDGGDELFHGYGMYNWAKRLKNPLVLNSRHLLSSLAKKGPSRYKRIASLLAYDKSTSFSKHIFSQEQYFFSDAEVGNILNSRSNNLSVVVDNYSHLERKLTATESQALFDLNYYLPDDLLTKVDRASMRYSLETRVPLLDHRIVEFAVNVNPKLKINKGDSKYLLKQVLYDYVPKEIFDRPKWGFGIPLNSWLKTDLKPMVDHYLSEKVIENVGLVNYAIVDGLKTRFYSGKEDYLYNRLWVLICLHKWYLDIFEE